MDGSMFHHSFLGILVTFAHGSAHFICFLNVSSFFVAYSKYIYIVWDLSLWKQSITATTKNIGLICYARVFYRKKMVKSISTKGHANFFARNKLKSVTNERSSFVKIRQN